MTTERVTFEVDCIRVRPGYAVRASLAVKVDGETIETLQRDYPPEHSTAEAAADILTLYRYKPHLAQLGE